jgi:hypothetical protein
VAKAPKHAVAKKELKSWTACGPVWLIFRAARSSSNICQPSVLFAPALIKLSNTFSPVSFTPNATGTASDTTLPALRTFG